jgi:hypothetical protein
MGQKRHLEVLADAFVGGEGAGLSVAISIRLPSRVKGYGRQTMVWQRTADPAVS